MNLRAHRQSSSPHGAAGAATEAVPAKEPESATLSSLSSAANFFKTTLKPHVQAIGVTSVLLFRALFCRARRTAPAATDNVISGGGGGYSAGDPRNSPFALFCLLLSAVANLCLILAVHLLLLLVRVVSSIFVCIVLFGCAFVAYTYFAIVEPYNAPRIAAFVSKHITSSAATATSVATEAAAASAASVAATVTEAGVTSVPVLAHVVLYGLQLFSLVGVFYLYWNYLAAIIRGPGFLPKANAGVTTALTTNQPLTLTTPTAAPGGLASGELDLDAAMAIAAAGSDAGATLLSRSPVAAAVLSAVASTEPVRVCRPCGGIVKPPRAHHCSMCNACVERMDHHCPWLGTCVGRQNHKHFVLFLLFLWVMGAYYAVTAGPLTFAAIAEQVALRNGGSSTSDASLLATVSSTAEPRTGARTASGAVELQPLDPSTSATQRASGVTVSSKPVAVSPDDANVNNDTRRPRPVATLTDDDGVPVAVYARPTRGRSGAAARSQSTGQGGQSQGQSRSESQSES